MSDEKSRVKKFSIKRLKVGLGVSEQSGKNWIRRYYEVETEVNDETSLKEAKNFIENFLNQSMKRRKDWNPENIEWKNATGPKGTFQIAASDNEDTENLKVELEKKKPFVKGNWFYWLLKSGSIARKRVDTLERKLAFNETF